MASLESKLFYQLLRLIQKKKSLDLQFAFRHFNFYNSPEPTRDARKICKVSRHQVNGRNVFTLAPWSEGNETHILYLHGGAYVQGFVRLHWKFLAGLVRNTGCTITAPDYPLAPASTYIDAYEMVIPVYREIMMRTSPAKIIVMGDSAGAGFALGLTQKMRDDGAPAPLRIILLCPWLDLTLTNPDIADIDVVDPFLNVGSLRKAGLAFTAQGDPANVMVSPINGTLTGLGEIIMFIGSYDLLAADCRKLVALASQAGVQIRYHEYEQMVHMWMLLDFPESRKARHEIYEYLRQS